MGNQAAEKKKVQDNPCKCQELAPGGRLALRCSGGPVAFGNRCAMYICREEITPPVDIKHHSTLQWRVGGLGEAGTQGPVPETRDTQDNPLSHSSCWERRQLLRLLPRRSACIRHRRRQDKMRPRLKTVYCSDPLKSPEIAL